MAPIYMAQRLAGGRHREMLVEAERRRLVAALPARPGTLQRFALRDGRLGTAPGGSPPAGRSRAAGLRAARDLTRS
jgi:hypothetical protein